MAYYDNAPAPVYASPVRSKLDADRVRALLAQATQQTRITKQSADFYDKTGLSEAAQKEEGIGIDALQAEAQGRSSQAAFMNAKTALAEHLRKMEGGSEEDKRANEMFFEVNSAAFTAEENGAKPEEVEKIYDGLIEQSGLKGMIAGNPQLSTYNRTRAQAMSEVYQKENSYEPATYRTKDGKYIAVNKNDVKRAKQIEQQNPGGAWLGGGLGTGMTGRDFNPQQDEVTQRDLMQTTVTATQIIDSVNDLIPMAQELKGFQSGVSGSVLRNVGGAVASVTDLVKEAGGHVKVNGKLVDDSTFLEEYLSKFTGASAEFKRNMARLGYLDARLQTGQTGRDLSNKDLENAMIGIDTSDKEQQLRILNSIGRNAQRMLRAKLAAVQHKKPSEVEISPEIQDYMEKDFSGKKTSPGASNMSDDDIKKALGL